jgi:Domain of unknown function (DUF2610)
MKRFTIPCKFGAADLPFHIYVGTPRKTNHPLQNQADWLSSERGGVIPPEVMDSIQKLQQIAIKNNVNFEDLCVYALGKKDDQTPAAEPKTEGANDTGETSAPRPYVIEPKWPPYEKGEQAEADDIVEKTVEQTAVRAMEVAMHIWPGADNLNRSTRNLFLGLAIYHGILPERPLTISEIFRTITSDDVAYSMCVALDTLGACMIPPSYGLIRQWLNNRRDMRDQILVYMTTGMMEFALISPKNDDPFRSMRKSLQKAVFRK